MLSAGTVSVGALSLYAVVIQRSQSGQQKHRYNFKFCII